MRASRSCPAECPSGSATRRRQRVRRVPAEPGGVGRGYATEGARALIRKGFTERGGERVTANVTAVNSASLRVKEKSGLSFVRHFTGDWPEAIEGSEHGEVEYELTRTVWERSHWRPGAGERQRRR